MPNHLHLLIEGQTDYANMKNFVSVFKQKSGYYYRRQFRKRLWQINYYEHILRKEEVTEKVMNYIFNNPVRKGIVDEWNKYPFLGSFALDVKQP
jgi:REP element-mobilizing transposase RayT